jgi:hypothetical protein
MIFFRVFTLKRISNNCEKQKTLSLKYQGRAEIGFL